VQDQRRRADAPEDLPHVGFGHDLRYDAGHARRARPVARQIPPRAKDSVAGNAWRDDPQHIETLLQGVGFEADGPEWFAAVQPGASRVVGCPQGACRAVDDHQPAHPLGIFGGKDHSIHPVVSGRQDRRLLASDGVHHRDRVFGPVLGAQHVHRGDA